MDEQNPDGITAYHGSPHEFEQFDTSKIGTGEGAQAYGHGLYFAESEPVAENYRDKLSPSDLYSHYDDDDKAWYVLDSDNNIHYAAQNENDANNYVRNNKTKGHMYEVHIDAHPDHFLDWDKPLSEQSEHVQRALGNRSIFGGDRALGEVLGRAYRNELFGGDVAGTDRAKPHEVSSALSNMGIHGIRYFDAGSRGPTDQPTHNYVVFDHDRVNIKRRYAEGGEVEGYKKGGIIHDEIERDINLGHFLYQSKVRNSDGDHVVLYHITPKDFDTFKPGGNDPRLSGPAIWLSPNKNYLPAAHNVGGMGNYDKGTNVMPVYANIKSPLVIDTPEMHEWAKKVYKSPELPYLLHPEAKQMMMDDGYDGIFYGLGKGSVEYGTHDVGIGQQPHGEEEIIAFHPHQIKSAIGNRGTFNPNDPDITKGDGGGVDRTKMSYKDVTQRVPELKEAAPKLGTDEMTPEMYQDLVNKHKPVQAWDHVPAPATQEEIYNALDANKRRNVGKGHLIPEGYPVGLRLDIPAYTNHGVWVPTIHDRAGSKPTVLAHEPAAHITNAEFNMSPNKALKVAQGGVKNPFATIDGSWNPTHPDDIHAMAQQYLNHPDWAQVGMDPERHSYFYDRRTQQPITHASEVLQVGPLVLAHKPVYGNKEDYPFKDGGVIAKHPAKPHNPAIVEYALNKISAPPPALDPTLMVAKRGRPF